MPSGRTLAWSWMKEHCVLICLPAFVACLVRQPKTFEKWTFVVELDVQSERKDAIELVHTFWIHKEDVAATLGRHRRTEDHTVASNKPTIVSPGIDPRASREGTIFQCWATAKRTTTHLCSCDLRTWGVLHTLNLWVWHRHLAARMQWVLWIFSSEFSGGISVLLVFAVLWRSLIASY